MVGTVIFNLFIAPLEYLFELVFSIAYRLFEQPLLVIISLSIVVNLFALPLYKRADAIQEEENEKQAKMSHWVEHIKKTFKGDERYMMMQTYYRQQHYKSVSSLRGSVSLLLQIPFFIAAYHYLSNLEILNSMSFWIFQNLGQPDGLLKIGALSVNVMPIIMTLINVGSAYIYLRGASVSQKIQTYFLAAAFLVLLYSSPSGLVIYWTCNQIFSLLKNVFMKLVKNSTVLGIFVSVIGIVIFLGMLFSGRIVSVKRLIFLLLIGIVCQIPLAVSLIKKRGKNQIPREITPLGNRIFILTGLFMAVFTGIAIPLNVIGSSASEFVTYSNDPARIVISNFATMLGVFVIWMGVYYFLGTPWMKNLFIYGLLALSLAAVADYFFWGNNLGVMSAELVYDNAPFAEGGEKILNLVLVLAVIACVIAAIHFLKKKIVFLVVILLVAVIGYSITGAASVSSALQSANMEQPKSQDDIEPILHLSRTGKNVIFIMFDRAIGALVPYLFHEKPELYEKFDGFTYYPNTISYGFYTHIGSPPLFGGYEYTPAEINARSEESLVQKHNEALKLMPVLFSENGYQVTICDPSYAGHYSNTPDLTVFDEYDNISAYRLMGEYLMDIDDSVLSFNRKQQSRNFFYYSIFRSVPVVLRNVVYDKGKYFSTELSSCSSDELFRQYSELEFLPELTAIDTTDTNHFLFMVNETSHTPAVTTYPDYMPGIVKDSEIYGDLSRFEDMTELPPMKIQTISAITHYNVNMAAFLKVGEWLDYLREQGVYDNTRIILAADHGRGIGQFAYMKIADSLDLEAINPLLLVKDFNAEGWTVSEEFMTNADVPYLAFLDLIDDPVNPSTGNPITIDAKYEDKYISMATKPVLSYLNHENMFDTSTGPWWKMTGTDMYNKDNWEQKEP